VYQNKPLDPFAGMLRKKRLSAQWRRFAAACRRPWRPTRIDSRRGGPPNLLMLAVDTLRRDHLGLAGYRRPTSPRLDALAAAGTCCDDVTAPAPWTLPSFTSSLCGVMPCLHGALLSGPSRNMDSQPPTRLDAGAVTLARHLRGHGYRTAAFYSNQFFAFGLAESFDEHLYLNLPAGDLARTALDWIRRHGDRPFFCFVLLNDPHEPTTPPPAQLAPFLDELAGRGVAPAAAGLRELACWGYASRPDGHLGHLTPPLSAAARQTLAIKLALYDATIAYVDQVIGTTYDRLAAWGLDRNTVVSFFSDHGEEFLDHLAEARAAGHDPRRICAIGHGHSHYQELLHVPWITLGPGVPAGVRLAQPVSLCDVAPTVADWLGVDPLPLPAATVDGLVGRSLVGEESIAEGTAARPHERFLLSEAIAYGPDLVAVRRDRWKLIATRAGQPLGLYDLATDPAEQNDMRATQPAEAAALLDHLATWRRAVPDPDGSGAGNGKGSGEPAASWDDLSETVRRRLKDLGYTE